MRRRAIALFLVSSAFPAIAAAQAPSPAPDASGQGGVEEIVVTAQKRAESLQDVPISIAAYSSEALEMRGANSLASLLDTPPPGVVLQANVGSQTMMIIDMRGVANSDPGQGTTELGTGIYVDDVYLGRAQGLGAEFVDPERIEVLRGPQGTLFGRNAEGGAIRIVTKKPTGEFGGSAKVGFGNYNDRRYEAHVNLPEIAGFSVKLDYLNTSHDGWTKNGPRDARLAVQKDFGEFRAEGYRASVRWKPIDSLTIDYAYEHSFTADVRDYYALVEPRGGFAPNTSVTPLATFQTSRPHDQLYKRVAKSWIPLYAPEVPTKTSGHTITAQLEINDNLTLKSITGFRKNNEKVGSGQLTGAVTVVRTGATGIPVTNLIPTLTPSLGGVPDTTRVYAYGSIISNNGLDQSQRSEELQLIGSTGEFEWVLGAYYFNEKVMDNRQTQYSVIWTDPGLTNAISTNPFVIGNILAGRSLQTAESTSYAGFAQATWTPAFAGEKLHLTAGVRYTDDKKTFARTISNGVAVNLTGQPFSAKRWDPAFTIAYDFTDNVNVYARYAQAYRAGGVSVRSPTFRPFGAEVNKSFEFGVKSDLIDRRLRANIALFENRISNRQISVQLDPLGNSGVTDTLNAPGTSRIRGVEVEIIAVPTDGLQVGLNYGYLNAKAPPSYKTIDPNATFFFTNVPEHSLTATLDYALPKWDFGQLAFHVDYSMASKRAATSRLLAGAFAWPIERNLTNARAVLRDIPIGPAEFQIALYGKNVFNKAYPVFAAPGAYADLTPPRSYGIEIGVNF